VEISTAARLSSRLPIISSAKAMLGLVWIGWGILAGPFRPLASGALVPFTVCGLALLGASVLSWWRGNALAGQVAYSETSTFFTVRQVNSGWLRVVLITSALIGFSILVLTRLSEAIWILPLVSVLLALHFFPLGRLFSSPPLYLVSCGIVLWILISMYSLPLAQIPFSVGLGTGAVLWTSVISDLASSYRARRALEGTTGSSDSGRGSGRSADRARSGAP
jgi:hypothetical protein